VGEADERESKKWVKKGEEGDKRGEVEKERKRERKSCETKEEK